MTQTDRVPDEATLSEALFAAMGVLRREARRAAGGRPWPYESLGGSQLELLRLIRRQPGVSVAEAATELGLAANSVSTLVGQLNEAGLIRRTPDPADRRVARLTLTDTARRHTDAWHDRRTAVGVSAISQLSATDRTRLAEALPVLGRITDTLRATSSEQSR